MAKLDYDDVISLRRDYLSGKSVSELADLYECSYSVAYSLARNLTMVNSRYNPGEVAPRITDEEKLEILRGRLEQKTYAKIQRELLEKNGYTFSISSLSDSIKRMRGR